MTVQVSNIDEYISYLTDSLVVPESVVVGESCICYFYNTEGVEWIGSGTRPIIYLSCSFTEVTDTSAYAISQNGDVAIANTTSVPNGVIGQWDDLVKSTNHTKPNCVMWESTYSQTGTYNVTVTFRRGGTNYDVTRSVEVTNDIIATATTTVKNGISTTGYDVLKPYSVYTAFYSNGLVECWAFDLSFTIEDIDVEGDWGWSDGDDLLLYVYPTNNIQTLFDDITHEGYTIDPENGISYVPHDDLEFVSGTNTVLVTYVAGMEYPDYSYPYVTLNDHEYEWNYSEETITQSTLIFRNGHSSNDFVAGQTYQITARYLENDGYEGSVDIGELEILKYPTTTTISGSSSVTIGENLTLSIVVKENNNNTTLTNGYITVYDGTDIVQQNYAITGNSTQITFTPSTTGTHNIYAIFTDSGTTYNTSRSNTLTVTVNKKPSTITTNVNSIETISGEQKTINGTLTTNGTGISGANITVSDSNNNVLMTVTTDSNGAFTFNYTLENLNDYNNNLSVEYGGTNIISASSKSIQVLPYQGMIYDLCNSLSNWNVTDSGNSATLATVGGSTAVKSPSTDYQRVYWKYPLVIGSEGLFKFKIYSNASNNAIILGTMKKYNNDHMTNVKSWWYGLGSSRNWTNGPKNSQNRHGGTRMSNNTWHIIEFRLNDHLLDTLQDGTSIGTYTIPTLDENNTYFNDYLFLAITGVIHIKDIEYMCDVSVSDGTLQSIRNAHLSQF